MKKLLSLLVFSLFCINSYAQVDIFDDLRGFPPDYFGYYEGFELSGMHIYISPLKSESDKKYFKNLSLSKSDIKKLEKQFSTKKYIVKVYRDSTINKKNIVIERYDTLSEKEDKLDFLCYIFQKDTETINAITFKSLLPINSIIVKKFINAYLANKLINYKVPYRHQTEVVPIPRNIFHMTMGPPQDIADSLNFVGRTINLENRDPNCFYWYRPVYTANGIEYRINGPENLEELTWSIFDSLEEAKIYNNLVIQQDKIEDGKERLTLLSDTTIDISLENIKTQARRIIQTSSFGIKDNLSQERINHTYYHYTYYIIQKVRGRYVTLKISYLIRNANYPNWLPPLTSEIMSLEPKDKD